MPTELRFDDRVAIITGAGGGLGRAYALLLAARGAHVVVNDLADGTGRSPAAAVVAEIRAAGGSAVAYDGSVADPATGPALVRTALDAYGRVDAVVSNAGIVRDRSFAKLSDQEIDDVLDVHLRGALGLTRAAWPVLREREYGRIVLTTSVAGLFGNRGQANYSAAKAAMVGLGRTLAIEGAKYGIAANLVSPGAATAMTRAMLPEHLHATMSPERVAPMVAYLCHASCALTGEILSAAAGRFARDLVVETAGYENPDATVEDVAAHLPQIMDTTSWTVPGEAVRLPAAAPPDRPERRIGPLAEWTAEGGDLLLTESIPEVLARQVAAHGDRPALYRPGGDGLVSVTYAELAADAEAAARALAGVVEPGGRVAVWSRNSVEWVLLEYACALAGLVITPFNTGWTDAEVRYATGLTTPALVFCGTGHQGESLVPRAAAACGDVPVLDLAGLRTWAARAVPADLPAVAADDPFLIQFTSGTTGRSKAALHTQRSALNTALLRSRADVIGDDDVWLNPVPYHHVGGSMSVILGGLVDAGAYVVIEKYAPAETLRLLDHGVVTRIGGVPTMVLDAMTHLGAGARDAGLRSVALGGATVTQSLVDRIRDALGVPVVITYGQSECSVITNTDLDADAATIAGTVGRPAPGTDLRITDPESGAVLPLGAVGEIQMRSPCRMREYWAMPEATAATITPEGFLRTGDLGAMDAHGHVTFQGRSRDVIIRGGENIYPAEVEELLAAHPGVAAAVLVGVDDERLGEQVAGVVVPAPGATVTADDLTAFLRDRVARFKIPVTWRFVDAFPMTASGKVRRFLVREETNAGRAGS